MVFSPYADIINLELALADLSQIEKRLEKINKGRSKGRG
jgi:ribosome-binding ATPase YchF (GTP1/OBG family)